jgi:hypothetical protein
MADARYYQITAYGYPSDKKDRIEKVIDSALDWYQFDTNCFIVWSSKTPEQWYRRLKPLLGSDGNVLIVGIDQDVSQGWMSQDFWDWLKKHPTKT